MVSFRACTALASSVLVVVVAAAPIPSGTPIPENLTTNLVNLPSDNSTITHDFPSPTAFLQANTLETKTFVVTTTIAPTETAIESSETSSFGTAVEETPVSQPTKEPAEPAAGFFSLATGTASANFLNGNPVEEDPGNPGGFGLWIILGIGISSAILLLALGLWYYLRRRRRARALNNEAEIMTQTGQTMIVAGRAVDPESGSIGSCQTAVEGGMYHGYLRKDEDGENWKGEWREKEEEKDGKNEMKKMSLTEMKGRKSFEDIALR